MREALSFGAPASVALPMEPRDSLDDLRSSAQMSARSASTPFLKLVEKGDCAAVAAALAAKPALACDKDYYENSGLHIAAAQRNLPLVQLLLGCEGTDLDAQEGVYKRSACHIVASTGASRRLVCCLAVADPDGAKACRTFWRR